MNLRALQYLVAVADERNFSRAAEACYVSQPTLSTQIKKLEQELDVQLVERNPRRVMLTPAGEQVVARAREILHQVAAVRETARRARDPEAGRIRLGLFPTLGPYLLPHVLPAIRERFPRLELLLYELKTEELLERLREGKLDAAVLALPVSNDGFEVRELFEEPFVLAAPAGHPLASKPDLGLDDLRDGPVLLLEDGHCLRDQALEVCRMVGAEEKDGFRATSLETLRQMVASGIGVTLLPTLATKPPVPSTDRVTLRALPSPAPSRRVALLWRQSSGLGELMDNLAALLRGLDPELLLPPEPSTVESKRAKTAPRKAAGG